MTTVLIADDEVVERQYLCRLFEKFPGFRLVGQAETGSQAVELAKQHRPDAIIMDINMPVLNGLEAAEAIRRNNPGQVIIINTAYAKFEYARQAVALHLDAYLLNPATAEEVLSTVEGCLWKKSRAGPGGEASIRAQLAYPHEIVEQMLRSLALKDPALFSADAEVFLAFLDREDGWASGYHLYLVNTVFGLGRQLSKLPLPDPVLELVDCEGCIRQLERAAGEGRRRLMEEFFRRVGLALQVGDPKEGDPVEAVCGYIQSHYAEDITLPQLANLAHFSPEYLSRLFRRKTGVTLRSYINQVRVEQAAHMLRSSRRRVNDIALDCGFCNLSHFHRVFKKHTGITPKEMRDRGND